MKKSKYRYRPHYYYIAKHVLYFVLGQENFTLVGRGDSERDRRKTETETASERERTGVRHWSTLKEADVRVAREGISVSADHFEQSNADILS